MNATTKKLIALLLSLSFLVFLFSSSLGQEYPEAYHFSLLVALLGTLPVLLLAVQVLSNHKDISFKFSTPKIKHYLTIVYIIISLQLYETIGFYTTGLIMFLVVSFTYHYEKINVKTILKTTSIAIAFIVIIYFLFAFLLRVQTPTGWIL